MSELKSVKQSDVLWGHWFTEYYLKSEADKVIADLEESHKMEVEQLLMEIVRLKEERRWHKYPDEKPTEEKVFLVLAKYLGEDDLHVDLCPYDITAEDFGEWEEEFCDGCKEGEEFISYDVKYWMPLTKAPKE